jgi:hypothetical protein
MFLISVILAFAMGSTGHDSYSFLSNVHASDTSNIVKVLVGGAMFKLANLLLAAAIDMLDSRSHFPSPSAGREPVNSADCSSELPEVSRLPHPEPAAE